jgi:hypothetical protein
VPQNVKLTHSLAVDVKLHLTFTFGGRNPFFSTPFYALPNQVSNAHDSQDFAPAKATHTCGQTK